MDTEEIIDELTSIVSQYETESFAGVLAYFLKRQMLISPDSALNRFDSKQKDFLYLIALNIFFNAKRI